MSTDITEGEHNKEAETLSHPKRFVQIYPHNPLTILVPTLVEKQDPKVLLNSGNINNRRLLDRPLGSRSMRCRWPLLIGVDDL
jgi:hypothetical protein